MGSGTTCVVAKKLDRRYFGIEKEPAYCAYAIERLERADENKTIQGYHDGFFWERNSLADQKTSKSVKNSQQSELKNLFDE
jgi:site-specific DNA-methyltransferase (adenine-specific)